jgi:hypothetical protein
LVFSVASWRTTLSTETTVDVERPGDEQTPALTG